MNAFKCHIKYYLDPPDSLSRCRAEVSLWLPTERDGELYRALCFRPDTVVAGDKLGPHWGSSSSAETQGYRVGRTWFSAPTWEDLEVEIRAALEEWAHVIEESYELYERAIVVRPRDRRLVAWYPNFEWEEEKNEN